MKGVTTTGFEFSYDPIVLDDMRFVDTLAELLDEKTDEFQTLVCSSRLLTMLLGKDQKERLYDHIAAKNGGRVPYSALEPEIQQIMGVNEEPGKN